MNPLSEIRESIRNMSSGNGGAGIFTAKVLDTDGDTCRVDIDGLVVSDVRLRAVVNGEESGILVTPKTGSCVTVADLSGGRLTQCVVIGYSEVEKITIDAEAETGIKINGGQNGGLVNIEELVNRLNYIENKIGDLMDVFNNWEPTPQDGGAALKLMAATWFPGPIKTSKRSDLEDTSVKH